MDPPIGVFQNTVLYLNRFKPVDFFSPDNTIHPSLYSAKALGILVWQRGLLLLLNQPYLYLEYSRVIPIVIVLTKIPYAFINLIACLLLPTFAFFRLPEKKNDTVAM